MTPEKLEEIKRMQLDAISGANKSASKFNISITSTETECEFSGTIIGIVAAAMTGLHELEQKFPEATSIIDAAFEGYRLLREDT
jgi:uncharacterized protein YlxP (DUF503 family)